MKRRSLLAFFSAAPLVDRPARAQRDMPVVDFIKAVSPDLHAFVGTAPGEFPKAAAALGPDPRPALPLGANEVLG